ncbi:hypothetical protein LINGRAPRIM_LOCUS1706 [Linum grandiflorum]
MAATTKPSREFQSLLYVKTLLSNPECVTRGGPCPRLLCHPKRLSPGLIMPLVPLNRGKQYHMPNNNVQLYTYYSDSSRVSCFLIDFEYENHTQVKWFTDLTKKIIREYEV